MNKEDLRNKFVRARLNPGDVIIEHIEDNFLYNLLKIGTLYMFFFIWCIITHVTIKTFFHFLKIKLNGYDNLSEERTIKKYYKKIGFFRVLFFSMIVLILNFYFLYFEITGFIFLQIGLLYITCNFLFRVLGIDIIAVITNLI